MIRYFEKSTEPGLNIYIKRGNKHLTNKRLSAQFEEFILFLYHDLGTDQSLTIVIQTKSSHTNPFGHATDSMKICLFKGKIDRVNGYAEQHIIDKYGSHMRCYYWVMAHEFGHIEHLLIDPNTFNLDKYQPKHGEIGKTRYPNQYVEDYADSHANLKMAQYVKTDFDDILITISEPTETPKSKPAQTMRVNPGLYMLYTRYAGYSWYAKKLGNSNWLVKTQKFNKELGHYQTYFKDGFKTKKEALQWLETHKHNLRNLIEGL